jgi:outer membrane protein OmpA-like peptidoglycan-associated protein
MINRSSFIKTLAVVLTTGGLIVGCGANVDKITKQAQDDAKTSFESEKAQIDSDKAMLQKQLDDVDSQLSEKDDKIRELREKLAELLEAEVTESGFKLTLGNGSFRSGKSKLNRQAMPKLENLAKFLNSNSRTVSVVGHTDNRGNEEKNQELSEKRASAVSSALMDLGVAEDRIETKGAGQSEPIADNDTAEGRRQNRRVEINISN